MGVTYRDPPTNLTFRFIQDDNTTLPFAIDPSSGKFTLSRALTKEAVYTFGVIADDHGFPPFSSDQVNISINVTFENVAPKFVGLPYTVFLKEKVVPPYPVFNFTVIDTGGGSLEGVDNVTLFPSNYSSYFSLVVTLNYNSGVTVAQLYQILPLVYQQVHSFSLNVLAYDLNATTVKSNSTTISVTVLNANPNPPNITGQPYVVSIAEGPYTTSSVFFQVSATDADENYPLVFSLVSTFGGTFQIDPSSGNVSVAKALSRSNSTSYQLVVVVTDTNGTGLNSTASLNVNVLQSYLYSPVFKTADIPSNLTLLDSTPVGYVLFNFTVTDQSKEAAVTVQLVPSNTVFGVVTWQQNGSLVGSLVVNKTLSWQVCFSVVINMKILTSSL